MCHRYYAQMVIIVLILLSVNNAFMVLHQGIYLTTQSVAKRDEVTKELRKLPNEELHIFTRPQILLGRSNKGE
jgi:hypothetical protein